MEMKVATATEGIALQTRLLHEMFPEKCGPAKDCFVTLIHRIDKYGVPKNRDASLCEITYATREQATAGHIESSRPLDMGGMS